MTLSDDQVRHVAKLARLGLTDEEVDELRPQLAAILSYAEKVGEVATADVAATSHAFGLRNVMRDDLPGECLPVDDALSTAPEGEDGRFRVPRIIAEEP